MFLKTVEIQGFKSFADKVKFDFSSGITAIVGPNGSGKSNVVDAIRWVLGEQSVKSLRGSKMEDVIFSGSSTRKPVGMARVTMVLDNSSKTFPVSTEEVEVSRTLYRSGESEYQLNKHTCRLKDVHELFMDTGLGKDGFSVIGQGKIEEILTLHAEDRRGLIEEAAGISKYKYRKREAERKLTATNDDMLRLDDLLFELEERLGPLAKQAEKVEKYHSWKKEEEKHLLDTFAIKYLQEEKLLHIKEKAIGEKNHLVEESQSRLQSLKEQTFAKKNELEYKRKLIDEIKDKLISDSKNHESLKHELALTTERRQNLLVQKETFSQELEKNEQLLLENQKQRSDLKLSVQSVEEELTQVNKVLKSSEETVSMLEKQSNDLNTRISFLQEQQFVIFSEQANNNNESVRLHQELSSEQARRTRVEQRIKELMEQKATTEKEKEHLSEAFSKESQSKQALEAKLSDIQINLKKYRENLNHFQYKQQILVEQRLKNLSRLETLKEFEASGEGYFQGVQSVLKATKQNVLRGIRGTIIQLLDIPSEYLMALENALGGSAQYVVVEHDKDAQRAIQWLKQEKKGRATFLPMNTVKGKRRDVQFNHDAVIGLALDLVSFKNEYEGIMAQLLGNIWVVNDLQSAVEISKSTGAKYRFVTLEGDVIAPGGSLSGGHTKKQSSIIFRKNEMNSLQQKIEEDHLNEKELQEHINNEGMTLKTHESLEQELITELNQIQFSMRERSLKLEQLDANIARINHEIKNEQFSQEELKMLRTEATKMLAVQEENAEKIENTLKSIKAELDEKKKQLIDFEDKLATERLTLQSWGIKQATLEQQYQNQHRRMVENELSLQNLEKSLATNKSALIQAEDSIRSYEKNISDYNLQIQASEQSLMRLEAAYNKNQEEVLSLQEGYEEKMRQYDIEKNVFDKNEKEFQRLEFQMENAREKLAVLSAQIQEVLSISPQEAIESADLQADVTRSEEAIKSLRRQITSLGDINFMALEEYQLVNERASFLRQQLEDLHQAKTRLEDVIKEMELTMSKRFKETFFDVNERFSRVFTEMFGGGHAHLELSLPNNYLETGVEIIAQPPGKKERPLTLLSGGERALTATALLFALLEVRPSPFVILDEIEAALDEANVDRFANFIKQYAAKSQFIVISHRRGTMEAASVLYGVTMDNDGVSKQISVRMADYFS